MNLNRIRPLFFRIITLLLLLAAPLTCALAEAFDFASACEGVPQENGLLEIRPYTGEKSAIQKSEFSKEWYIPYLKNFSCEVLQLSKKKVGYIPLFIKSNTQMMSENNFNPIHHNRQTQIHYRHVRNTCILCIFLFVILL